MLTNFEKRFRDQLGDSDTGNNLIGPANSTMLSDDNFQLRIKCKLPVNKKESNWAERSLVADTYLSQSQWMLSSFLYCLDLSIPVSPKLALIETGYLFRSCMNLTSIPPELIQLAPKDIFKTAALLRTWTVLDNTITANQHYSL